MAENFEGRPDLWSIVLAGGDGERTRDFIERWLGRHKPKQYCTFVGTRSLFQHTVDRADRVGAPDRRIAVVARWHEREVEEQMDGRPLGRVLLQPDNRGTAAGVFLPLAHVLAQDPEATVVLYPSDHFVYPERELGEVVRAAALRTATAPERIVLLGAAPDEPERDYGWIEPGRLESVIVGRRVRAVNGFLEKPSATEADRAMSRGAFWNTFILVARAETLWSLGRRCVPELLVPFEWLRRNIGAPAEGDILDQIYRRLPERDFSRHVLQRAPDRLSVMEMDGLVWSDWGRPERILATLERIGTRPAFPESILAS